jgi:O-acetyl-ADP-ribose deacetylase (regulator of RNase III)
MNGRIELIQGDITTMKVDAIVNAANASLMGGGGVDGAIHRAAGPELAHECRTLGGAKTGEAKITKGYKLPAKFVIHTVGPVWSNGTVREEALLASCYRESLRLAAENNIRSIAFPSISTGAYRFPFDKACQIALQEIKLFIGSHALPDKIFLVVFSRVDFDQYKKVIADN